MFNSQSPYVLHMDMWACGPAHLCKNLRKWAGPRDYISAFNTQYDFKPLHVQGSDLNTMDKYNNTLAVVNIIIIYTILAIKLTLSVT